MTLRSAVFLSPFSSLPLLILLLLIQQANEAAAQDVGPLQVRGTVGVAARGYAASGIANRRAPGVLEAFANTSFNLLGLTSGLNLSWSTDQSGLRQSMNRLALSVSWKNGEVSAGDVSPRFSRYSLNGTTLRGGSVEYHPGRVQLAFAGGRSKRAVAFTNHPDFRSSSFRQFLFAGRVGYGEHQSSHFHLIGLYGFDETSSLDEPEPAVPAENLSFTPDFAVHLMSGRLSIEGNVTASAVTRGRESSRVDEDDFPFWVKPFMTTRAGTRVGYAGEAAVAFRHDLFDLNGAYSRIQPGFESMGLQQTRSDEETVRISPRLRLLHGRVNLGVSYAHSRNNLLDDKISTLSRNQADLTAQVRLSQSLSLSGTFSNLRNENDPAAGAPEPIAIQQLQTARTFMLSPVWAHQTTGGSSQAVSLTLTYQTLEDQSDAVKQGFRPGFGSDNITATASYSVRLPSSLMLSASGNFLSSTSSGSDADVLGGTIGLGYRLLNQKLITNANLGWSRNEVNSAGGASEFRMTSNQYTVTVTSSYLLPNGDAIRFQLRGLSNNSSGERGSFEEVQTLLRFDHRF